MKITVYDTADLLYDGAAALFSEHACKAIGARRRFSVALSGGRAPRGLYERLAGSPWRDRIDWPSIHVFWSDERCVPPDDTASNYRTSRLSLLDRVPIPQTNTHRIEGDRRPLDAADAYEVQLRSFLGPANRIDFVLLGMGSDGHTASLFPRHQALLETQRWILPVHTSAEPPWRITMTLPLINTARHVLFLVTGSEKAQAVKRIRAGEHLPASRIAPDNGDVSWLIDREAGGDG